VAEGQETGATQAKIDTIVAGDGKKVEDSGQQQPQATATWPEDWRQKMAGDDTKVLERLQRFTDPSGVLKWATEAEKKINSGLLKRGLPEGASADEVAAYRKEIGIPDKAEEYPVEPPKEVTVSEADKPVLDAFKKFAHENAIEPKVAQNLANWYFANRELELQDLHEHADQALQDRIVELRTEWPGNEYTQNVTLGNNFIAEVMGEKGPELAGVMLADGTKLGSHPLFVRLAAQAARTYSAGSLDLGGGGDAAGGEARITDIEKLMRDQRSDYWRGPKAESIQQEYRDLITRRDRNKSRAA
jgi:hypothetical protein